MDIKNLKSMVRPFNNNPEHPYYRPFVVNNIDEKYVVFLVGINPATPIYNKEKNFATSLYPLLTSLANAFGTKNSSMHFEDGTPNMERFDFIS